MSRTRIKEGQLVVVNGEYLYQLMTTANFWTGRMLVCTSLTTDYITIQFSSSVELANDKTIIQFLDKYLDLAIRRKERNLRINVGNLRRR